MKRIIAALLLLLGAAAVVVGAPARAGTGYSQACENGYGGTEYVVMTQPMTLGVQTGPGYANLCLSTTSWGQPGGAGGIVQVRYAYSTAGASVTVASTCAPDTPSIVWPSCDTGDSGAGAGSVSRPTTYSAQDTGGPCLWVLGTQYLSSCTSATKASYNPADGPSVGTPSTGICLLSAGSTCYAYLAGVVVRAGYDSAPTVRLETPFTGSPVDVNVPQTCYAVLASCP